MSIGQAEENAKTLTTDTHPEKFWQFVQPTGRAQLKVLFWQVYDAWYYQTNSQQALRLRYLRDFSKNELIKETLQQWKRMELYTDSHQKWLDQLVYIWPDISAGDELTLLIDAQASSYFFYNNQLIGSISAQNFGQDFLMIWLGEEAEYPDVRDQLLGHKSK
ncbi:chalcone isomerase family protein [Catenovulum sediminis]|uniref:Chalcone isomerase family protein n=1 Tax=Catenovulum sediminis TaxID=1740262 RepID=A0ABV1RKR3_9ALTE